LQLGRRNLTPQQASYFRGLRYNNEKSERGKYDRVTDEGLINVDDYFESKKVKVSTASKKLSEEYKVSPATIRRDAEFAEGLRNCLPPYEMKSWLEIKILKKVFCKKSLK
jgi:hypothetical protein